MVGIKNRKAPVRPRHFAGLAGIAIFVLTVLAPVTFDGDGLTANSAMARGGGNGGGNGNGGGHGKGHGKGGDGGRILLGTAENGGGNANGHSHARTHSHDTLLANDNGETASQLGSLTAAHASPKAFENANGNSVIGALRN